MRRQPMGPGGHCSSSPGVGPNPCCTDWACVDGSRGPAIGPKYVHEPNQLLTMFPPSRSKAPLQKLRIYNSSSSSRWIAYLSDGDLRFSYQGFVSVMHLRPTRFHPVQRIGPRRCTGSFQIMKLTQELACIPELRVAVNSSGPLEVRTVCLDAGCRLSCHKSLHVDRQRHKRSSCPRALKLSRRPQPLPSLPSKGTNVRRLVPYA